MALPAFLGGSSSSFYTTQIKLRSSFFSHSFNLQIHFTNFVHVRVNSKNYRFKNLSVSKIRITDNKIS